MKNLMHTAREPADTVRPHPLPVLRAAHAASLAQCTASLQDKP